MKTAKVFPNGGSQAVRLPKEFQFSTEEVYVSKLDGMVILFPKDARWDILKASLERFSDDFMAERDQPASQQKRSGF